MQASNDDPKFRRWQALGAMTKGELCLLKDRFDRETGTVTWSTCGPFHTWKKDDMVSYFMWGGAEHWDWRTGPAAAEGQTGPAMVPGAGCDSGTGTDSKINRENGANS